MKFQNELVYSLSLRFMGKRCKKQFFSNNFFYNEVRQNFPLIINRNLCLPHLLSPKSVFYLTKKLSYDEFIKFDPHMTPRVR